MFVRKYDSKRARIPPKPVQGCIPKEVLIPIPFSLPKKKQLASQLPLLWSKKYKGNGTLNLLPILIIIRRWHQFGNTYPPFLPLCKTHANCKDNAMCKNDKFPIHSLSKTIQDSDFEAPKLLYMYMVTAITFLKCNCGRYKVKHYVGSKVKYKAITN
jgi:hypothetical protein